MTGVQTCALPICPPSLVPLAPPPPSLAFSSRPLLRRSVAVPVLLNPRCPIGCSAAVHGIREARGRAPSRHAVKGMRQGWRREVCPPPPHGLSHRHLLSRASSPALEAQQRGRRHVLDPVGSGAGRRHPAPHGMIPDRARSPPGEQERLLQRVQRRSPSWSSPTPAAACRGGEVEDGPSSWR